MAAALLPAQPPQAAEPEPKAATQIVRTMPSPVAAE
jgi:hypothetical protein